LPPGLKGGQGQEPEMDACDATNNKDDAIVGDTVDATLSDDVRQDIKTWQYFDANNDVGFCEVDGGDNCTDCVHVDLTKNPERYTGYNGEAAHKIWRTIYQENCFRPPEKTGAGGQSKASEAAASKTAAAFGLKLPKSAKKLLLKEYFVSQEQLGELCLEKRAFYRAVSGLHASITIHLSSRYPKSLMKNQKGANNGGGINPFARATGPKKDDFVPNLDLFLSRFDPALTKGRGPFWLKNLYFVYLLELRALLKAKPFLEGQAFYTGDPDEDRETRAAVSELLAIVASFPDHFDETRLFSGEKEEKGEDGGALKAEFIRHFRNVSRVMDCVSCDKCKLWGKLQTTGLGTALKILFTRDAKLQLSRNEMVSLFNAFGRIATSIQQLENFRQQLRDEDTSSQPHASTLPFT